MNINIVQSIMLSSKDSFYLLKFYFVCSQNNIQKKYQVISYKINNKELAKKFTSLRHTKVYHFFSIEQGSALEMEQASCAIVTGVNMIQILEIQPQTR